MQSIQVLTKGLIDYAGLFPPAQLGMNQAVSNFSAYLESPSRDILGRFVLPASRLAELTRTRKKSGLEDEARPWPLAVLIGKDLEADVAALEDYRASTGSPKQYAIEMAATDVATVRRLKDALNPSDEAFIEVALTNPDVRLLDAIVSADFSAKMRTGGVVPDSFPSAQSIVRFMEQCRERGLAFKATAGLHHIVCDSYPLTYERESAKSEMFGFLNIFVAAGFIAKGSNDRDVLSVLREREASAFRFENSSLRVRDQSLSLEEIIRARQFALSFGSCSFTEPVEELHTLLAMQSGDKS